MGIIYCIRNKINSKCYVGSTINPDKRRNEHFNWLRKNKHHSAHLQRAFNKYGEENFEFLILENVIESENIITREQYWIDNSSSEYNVCPVAGNCAGRIVTEETRKKISYYNSNLKTYSEETRLKISESKKGIKRDTSNWNWKYVPLKVYEYNKDGEFIKEWNSVKEISKHYYIKLATINNALHGEIYLSKTLTAFRREKLDSISPYEYPRGKKVAQYDLKGNLIKIWNTATEASIFLKLKSSSAITNNIKERSKSAKGFIWKYIKENNNEF